MPAARSAVLCAAGLLVFATSCGAGDDLRGAMERASEPSVAAPATAPAPAAEPQGADDAGPAGPCTGPELAVSLGAPRASGDTVDSVDQDLIFQNTGSVPCVMHGFPSVVAVAGNDGVPVGEPALPVDGRGGPVRLEPRAAATVPLRVVGSGTYDDAVCRPRTVRGLRVVPAGGSGPLFVPREDRVCSTGPLPEPQMTVRTTVAR